MGPRPDPSGVSSGGSRVSTKASFSREAAVSLEGRFGWPGGSAQDAEQLVEQCRDLAEERVERESAVEQSGDGAEQVADQFPRSGLRGDVQVHGVQVHLQSEQIEIQRSENEVQDLT